MSTPPCTWLDEMYEDIDKEAAMRAEFETIMEPDLCRLGVKNIFAKRNDGAYSFHPVRIAWASWQAAIKAAEKHTSYSARSDARQLFSEWGSGKFNRDAPLYVDGVVMGRAVFQNGGIVYRPDLPADESTQFANEIMQAIYGDRKDKS